MIKVNNKRIFRETKADWQYLDDNDELKTEKIRVIYCGRTTKDVRQAMEKAKNQEVLFYSEQLIQRQIQLPDLVDDSKKPIEITIDWLDSQETTNIKSLIEAIEADENPKPQETT